MNWDDLRYVLTLSKVGSLARAAKVLSVDHTTVGRRITAAEQALGVTLFTRTTLGYVPTGDAMRLLAPMTQVEEAVLALERSAHASHASLAGAVRVTSPETFGVSYLAPRLAAFGAAHRGLSLALEPGGEVRDLGRRQAEVAVRFFRSRDQHLVVRRVAEVSYGLYASSEYLARHPVKSARELKDHPLLVSTPGPNVVEAQWVKRLTGSTPPAFVSTLSLALLNAARASAGVAVLPRYLGDAEPTLRRLDMPDAPSESVWLTVHRDLKQTPRVRAVLDFLAASMKADAGLLRGRE